MDIAFDQVTVAEQQRAELKAAKLAREVIEPQPRDRCRPEIDIHVGPAKQYAREELQRFAASIPTEADCRRKGR